MDSSGNGLHAPGAFSDIRYPLSITNVQLEETLDHTNKQSPIEQKEKEILGSIKNDSATRGAMTTCRAQLDELIDQNPTHASAYVSRTQVTRLLLPEEDLFNSEHRFYTTSILTDLTEAIALATPRTTNDPVSHEGARILASAHTQRGSLLYKAAKSPVPLDAALKLPSVDKSRLEELASRDFFWGRRYAKRAVQQGSTKMNSHVKHPRN